MTQTPLRELPLGEFALDSETDGDLISYIVVGRAVIRWGSVEQNFNHLVAGLFRKFGGAKEPPFALKRKIEFWNKCFRDQDSLSYMRDEAIKFSRDLTEAKNQRDVLLHFAWATDDKDPKKPLKGRSLRSVGNSHQHEDMDLPLRAINGLVNRTQNLDLRLMGLTFQLWGLAKRK